MFALNIDYDRKNFNALENILQKINGGTIALSEDEKRLNQHVLDTVVHQLFAQMSRMDIMFEKMARNIFYGGGYFDGLKIKNPDEYDLDVVFALPKLTKPVLLVSGQAGFVQVKLTEYGNFKKLPEYKDFFRKIDKFVDSNNFLLSDKVRDWFEGLLVRAKDELEKNGELRHAYWIRKSGPAFTLMIKNNEKMICVDLVPSFTFTGEQWPGPPFRSNPIWDKPNFLIVPKAPKNAGQQCQFWRLSFQEQERVLIIGKDRLKDTIRLLKLLRDTQGHVVIASYYIKTLVLWMCQIINDDYFWSRNSLSYVFMMVMKYYSQALDAGKICYYWDERNNLLEYQSSTTIYQCSQRIKRIISKIENSLNCPEDLEKIMLYYFVPTTATPTPQNDTWTCVIQ